MNAPRLPTAVKLNAALALQRAAQLEQPMPSLAQRQADLRTLSRFVKENREALIQAISTDYGHRSRHETLMMEIAPVLSGIRHALKHLKSWMAPQKRAVDRLTFGLGSNEVIPQPLGVVGVIVPWNFPLNMSLVPLTSIFAAGNRAMVKMSENSRHLAKLLAQTLPAYFPPEKLQVFDETGDVGPQFSQLPFDHLLFTGSSATGRAVMAAAASNLCPVTLELGGRSPALVCDDFDLKTAAERILLIKFLNAGQVCTTVDHVFLPQAKLPAFVELAQAIVPKRYASIDSPDLSSIIDRRSYQRLRQALNEARAGGATVLSLVPGKAFDERKHRIAPHLVIGAPEHSELMQREVFGPILPVIGYGKLDEAVARINAGPRPLAFYPFSRNEKTIQQLLGQVMSGGVTVNDALMHVGQDDLPFGGVGESGMGHYHGHEGFNTFSKLRPVFRQARVASTALLAPPFTKLTDKLLAVLAR
jgi:coniferyl-aldehyde dehydrogenase